MAHTDGKPDYTNTTAFPVFASKAELIDQILNPHNYSATSRYEFAARVANTDLSTLADENAVDIGTLSLPTGGG